MIQRKKVRKKIAELEEELERKKTEIAVANCRRMEREIKEAVEKERERILLNFIEIYENLRMAYKQTDDEGIKIILNQFREILEKEGIREIKATGKKFDYRFHHAVSVEKSEKEEGIIIEEIKKGYMLNGKVLRPSYVIVSGSDTNVKNNRN